jgi:hypothetical protein
MQMTAKKSNSPMAFDDAKWRAEEDMRTLTRAKEIEADRARLAAAQKVATQKIKEMQSVVAKKPAARPTQPARKK